MLKTQFQFILWVLCSIVSTQMPAQEYFRFKAAFSIKEKALGDTQGQLILGTIFYDKNARKVNHIVRFPEKENWMIQDTTMYRVVNDSLVSKTKVLPFGEFSIYNMILSQQLTDFGLSKGGYTMSKVEDNGNGKTTSTWEPAAQLKDYLGNVVIQQEQKRVIGVAFYNKDNQLQGKFFFQEYQVIEGLPVPFKIYQKLYLAENKEFNRIISFSDVIINQDGEDEKYDFNLPDR